MFLRIVLIVAVVIAAVLVFAATRPNTFRVYRSLTINAPPERIFPLINDLHNWPRWAPQDRDDPTMKRTYSGAASGTDAVSDWAGKGSAGKGQMTIIDSTPLRRVVVKVDFVKPFVARNVNEFTLEPGASTRITWTMQGSNLYFMKLLGIFVNMDRMMGKHFESGLQNLKRAAES
jgi:uncharacterized protein YndB with AHSA1/START domain